MDERPGSGIDLYWIPLGAGDNTHCVRTNGRLYEAWCARREHREREALFHAALVVHDRGTSYAIEMAPVWSAPEPGRGVACTGPVGLRWLGRSRWFRYEVRCWRDGVIPDLAEALDGAQRVSHDPAVAARVLDLLPDFPTATWGRDDLHTGDMWNSNSLVAWALLRAGADLRTIGPPSHGRAPGWKAGLAVAERQLTSSTAAPTRSPRDRSSSAWSASSNE